MRVVAVVTLQAKNHGHVVAAAKLFAIAEVPTVRTSHLSEADTSGILGHHSRSLGKMP